MSPVKLTPADLLTRAPTSFPVNAVPVAPPALVSLRQVTPRPPFMSEPRSCTTEFENRSRDAVLVEDERAAGRHRGCGRTGGQIPRRDSDVGKAGHGFCHRREIHPYRSPDGRQLPRRRDCERGGPRLDQCSVEEDDPRLGLADPGWVAYRSDDLGKGHDPGSVEGDHSYHRMDIDQVDLLEVDDDAALKREGGSFAATSVAAPARGNPIHPARV